MAHGEQKTTLGRIDAAVKAAKNPKSPPIDQWHPTVELSVALRIGIDGQWSHDGEPVQRESLVALFLSILRREAGGYYLITPHEKARIEVADAPILVTDVEWKETKEGELTSLYAITQTGQRIEISAEHPLVNASVFRQSVVPLQVETEGLFDDAWYILLPRGLSARLSRPVYYRLADKLQETAEGDFGLRVGGHWFALVL
ncbi:MAG: DUF1285 domain-containing protein [Hahellaceae bacterium]|nr:DUF1285 domain-containing protein [Hahellaceae bacterium]